jgi:4-amino-4-deoxy-L-arabinose transferase-like glycosyltransferase
LKYLKTLDFLAIGIFLLTLTPYLFQHGMFVDGVTYGAISRNLAEGIGTLDTPSYSAMYPEFHEHPPFFFWVEGLAFWLFGDQFFIERLTGIILGLTGITGVFFLQKTLSTDEQTSKHSYLSVLLWISFPLVSWAYNNNTLETLLIVLTLFASGFYLDGYLKNQWWKVVIGTGFLILGFLTKGFVALFPLSVIPLHFLFLNKRALKPTLLFTLLTAISLVALGLLLLFTFPQLVESVQLYFNQQLIPALKGEREITTGNRAKILLDLLSQLVVPLVILIGLMIRKRLKQDQTRINWKLALFLAAVGLSASVPLMISLKQRPFYLLPALPFFALSLHMLIAPFLKFDPVKINGKKWLLGLTAMVWIGVIIIPMFTYNSFSRNQQVIEDIQKISTEVPEQTIIGGPVDLWGDWGLSSNLSRIAHLGLKCSMKEKYVILPKGDARSSELSADYKPVNLDLHKFTIWKKSGPAEVL